MPQKKAQNTEYKICMGLFVSFLVLLYFFSIFSQKWLPLLLLTN